MLTSIRAFHLAGLLSMWLYHSMDNCVWSTLVQPTGEIGGDWISTCKVKTMRAWGRRKHQELRCFSSALGIDQAVFPWAFEFPTRGVW